MVITKWLLLILCWLGYTYLFYMIGYGEGQKEEKEITLDKIRKYYHNGYTHADKYYDISQVEPTEWHNVIIQPRVDKSSNHYYNEDTQ